MSVTFNADEMFEIAQWIERNGAKFYRRAAEVFPDSPLAERFASLAQWEEEHERTFAKMRAELKESEKQETAYDPYDEAALYLRALATGKVFAPDADPSAEVDGAGTVKDVVSLAIGKEKDSILFYTGMRELVPPRLGREKLEAIIKEEMKHVAMLNKELAQLG